MGNTVWNSMENMHTDVRVNRLMTNNAEILWKPGHNYSTVFHSLKQGLAIFSLWHLIKNTG